MSTDARQLLLDPGKLRVYRCSCGQEVAYDERDNKYVKCPTCGAVHDPGPDDRLFDCFTMRGTEWKPK